MLRAYARVSTKEQAEDGTTSISEQVRKCKAIASLRGETEFIAYTDAGVRGSIPLNDRPEGANLLAEAVKGDVICASKMDRLFRSASDALNTAERLKKAGIDLVLIDMGTDPVTANGAAKMFFGMLALVAEFERERIAERMVDGKRGKKERNGHIGGVAPFGYHVVGTGRDSRLEPEVIEQDTLARIRALIVNPRMRKPYRICKRLNEDGVPSRTGTPWRIPQVQRILQRLSAQKAA